GEQGAQGDTARRSYSANAVLIDLISGQVRDSHGGSPVREGFPCRVRGGPPSRPLLASYPWNPQPPPKPNSFATTSRRARAASRFVAVGTREGRLVATPRRRAYNRTGIFRPSREYWGRDADVVRRVRQPLA